MQIIAEIDTQRLDKLQELKKSLGKNTSELISLAIDELYNKQQSTKLNEGQKAHQIIQQLGFIGSIEKDASDVGLTDSELNAIRKESSGREFSWDK